MQAFDIDWLLPDGDGAARVGKQTVVVPGALVGERVSAELPTGKRKGLVRAENVTILKASESRRTPPCPHNDRCGGCDLSHAEPSARLKWLAAGLARNLGIDVLPVVASPRADSRARVRLSVDNGQIGYRAPRSHDLVAIESCRIARPEISERIDRLRRLPGTALDGLTHIELRTNGQRCVADLSGSRASDAVLDALEDASLNHRVVRGDPTLWLDGDGLALRASPGAFFQVNLEVNQQLVRWVVDQCAGDRTIADLYCGIGNFSLPLARAGATVRAVELAGQAIGDLRASAQLAGLSESITAIVADADRYEPSQQFVDAVVLDPPRRGCTELMHRIVTARTPKVVLVSCDPRSALRDTRILQQGGYRLTAAHAFDLFVDTHHLELATVWSR